MELPRRILVPTDFSATSDRALNYAFELAKLTGGSLTVLHAYELPLIGFPDGALIATAEIASRISNAAQMALTQCVESRAGRGVEIRGVLKEGIAHEEVINLADEINADLVVIGTHGRRGLARALLGSVAENIIRQSMRPVLTIHGPRE